MPTKEKLLSSIKPDMCLTKDFFKKVFGYELSFPGFADEALENLETAGCGQARRYYTEWVQAYEEEQQVMLKSVAEWYRRRCEDEWNARLKGSERRCKELEAKLTQKNSTKWMEGLF